MPESRLIDVISARFAVVLREERERQGLSMNAVAERAGLSQQMVSYVERGLRNPTLNTLLRLAGALGIDLPVLLARAMPAERSPKTRPA